MSTQRTKLIANAGTNLLTHQAIIRGVTQTWQIPPGDTIEVPLSDEELAQQTADEAAAAANETAEQAALAAANQRSLIQQRNRWLVETDAYLIPAASAPPDMPTDVQAAVTANIAAIKSWRQQLRDWPATITDWTKPGSLPAPPNIALPSGRQLIITS